MTRRHGLYIDACKARTCNKIDCCTCKIYYIRSLHQIETMRPHAIEPTESKDELLHSYLHGLVRAFNPRK